LYLFSFYFIFTVWCAILIFDFVIFSSFHWKDLRIYECFYYFYDLVWNKFGLRTSSTTERFSINVTIIFLRQNSKKIDHLISNLLIISIWIINVNFQDTVFESYLSKTPAEGKGAWRRRWCILVAGKILYYKNVMVSIMGNIGLSNSIVRLESSKFVWTTVVSWIYLIVVTVYLHCLLG
jgi:hypothetical protein